MESKCATKVIIVFAVILFVMWIMFPRRVGSAEGFDVTGTEFVGLGQMQYDMRGDPVKRSCILRTYQKPNRQIRLNMYGAEMYASDYSPPQEGKRDCRKVNCPTNADYDDMDTCWTCGSMKNDRMTIPDIHPHVMN